MVATNLVELVCTEVALAGGQINRVVRSRHIKVAWTLQGRKFLEVLPATTSDWRMARNVRARVRRHARVR
jgi:hypothetical protein